MMHHLNLLSPERRKAVNGRVLFSVIERLMVTLVILALAATVIMAEIKTRLTQNLSNIQFNQTLSEKYDSVNEQIKDLNTTISVIEKLQKEVTPSSVFLADIIERVPEGITISFLGFDASTRSMSMNGFAPVRNLLLDFEASLLDSPYIETLDSPISNFFQKTDLNFRFQAIVNTERLQQKLEPLIESEDKTLVESASETPIVTEVEPTEI